MREREEQKWLHQLVTPRIQKKGQIVDFCMLQVLNHAGHPQSIDGTTYRRCGLWLACLAIVWGQDLRPDLQTIGQTTVRGSRPKILVSDAQTTVHQDEP